MREVLVPAGEMNRFDLPWVCLVTGALEGVDFKRVTLRAAPRWLEVLLVLGVVPGLIAMNLLTEHAVCELPFTGPGYRRHRRNVALARSLSVVGFLAFLATLIGLLARSPLVPGAVLLGVLILRELHARTSLPGGSVRLTGVGASGARLVVPNDAAAEALETHLHGGATVPLAAVPVP